MATAKCISSTTSSFFPSDVQLTLSSEEALYLLIVVGKQSGPLSYRIYSALYDLAVEKVGEQFAGTNSYKEMKERTRSTVL